MGEYQFAFHPSRVRQQWQGQLPESCATTGTWKYRQLGRLP